MTTEDKEIILLKVSGHDKPGVTAGLTAVLATYDAVILDIGQADILDTLSLGILFEIQAGSTSWPETFNKIISLSSVVILSLLI